MPDFDGRADAVAMSWWYAIHFLDKVKYAAMAEETASIAATAGTLGGVLVPLAAWMSIFIAMAEPYKAAEKIVANRETNLGFFHGFVMGILDWPWHFVVDLFAKHYRYTNAFNPEIDSVEVKSYNFGLKAGYALGFFIPDEVKKKYLEQFRTAGNIHNPSEWSRRFQIGYVIELAAVAQRYAS